MIDEKEVIFYLEYVNKWRRGADIEQPEPEYLGQVIDEAIKLLKKSPNNQ